MSHDLSLLISVCVIPCLGWHKINSGQSFGNSRKASSSARQSARGLLTLRYCFISRYLGQRPVSGVPVLPTTNLDRGLGNLFDRSCKSELKRQLEDMTTLQGCSKSKSLKSSALQNKSSAAEVVE